MPAAKIKNAQILHIATDKNTNHPAEYHLGVWDKLNEATRGLEGEAYTKAFKSELTKLGVEIATPGTRMNDLVTGKQKNQVSNSKGSADRSSSNAKGSSISSERRNDNRTKQ